MMNKKLLTKVGVVGGALALAVAAAVPTMKFMSNANSNTEAVVQQAAEKEFLQVLEEDERVNYNVLATIKSKSLQYEDVKDKVVVLAYSSNNTRDGYVNMDMNVEEYEADGTTPKVVNFTADVETVQTAHTAYTIYAFAKEDLNKIGRAFDFDYEEYDQYKIESGLYEAGFLGEEKENPNKVRVTLSSTELKCDEVKLDDDTIYTPVTYKVNGGKEKTVYALRHTTNEPDSCIISHHRYEVAVYANVGDEIEYKVAVPAEDGQYEEVHTATVVE